MITIKDVVITNTDLARYVQRAPINIEYSKLLASRGHTRLCIVSDSCGNYRVFETLIGEIRYLGQSMLTKTEIKLYTRDISNWRPISNEEYKTLCLAKKNTSDECGYSAVFGGFGEARDFDSDENLHIESAQELVFREPRPEGVIVKTKPEVSINTTVTSKGMAEYIITLLKKEFDL